MVVFRRKDYISKSVIVGFLLALLGVSTSVYFYYKESKPVAFLQAEPLELGYVRLVKNDVQKRQFQNTIWHPVKNGAVLFSNEMVFVAANSQSEIDLSNSAQLVLDSGTAIRFWQTDQGVNLDLIRGHFLVRWAEPLGRQMFVNSGSVKVLLKSSEVSFDLSDNQKILDVEVYSGSAEIKQRGTVASLDKNKLGRVTGAGIEVLNLPLRIKSPKPYSSVYSQSRSAEPVVFEWEPISEKITVFLEIGADRDNMERMNPPVTGNTGFLAMRLPIGKYYWRLATHGKKKKSPEIYSSIRTFTTEEELPVQLISPVGGVRVAASQQTGLVAIRWANPSHLEKLQLEISRDSQFSYNYFSESVDDTGFHGAPISDDGIYFWRISGFRPGTTKEIVSQIHWFKFYNQ